MDMMVKKPARLTLETTSPTGWLTGL